MAEGMGQGVPTRQVAEANKMKIKTASGGKMEHYGEKRVNFMT